MSSNDKNTDLGLRYNEGKAELHLVPTSLRNSVAKVLMYGAQKYETNNWRKGMSWTTVYNCLMRHMDKWLDGEELDAESGLPHLYHAAANIAMLIEYKTTCPELDDRFTGLKSTYKDCFEDLDFNEYKDKVSTVENGKDNVVASIHITDSDLDFMAKKEREAELKKAREEYFSKQGTKCF